MNASVLDAGERELLRDGFRRFSRERAGCEVHAPDDQDATQVIREEWRRLAQQGWLSLGLPDTFGGYGLSIGDLGLLMRAAGEGRWRAPLVECLGEACGVLLVAPPSGARDGLLARIVAGEAIVGVVGAGDGTDNVAFDVTATGGRFHVTGARKFVTAGHALTHLLLTARGGPAQDDALYLLETSALGVQWRNYPTLDQRCAGDLTLDDVEAERLAEGHLSLKAARDRGHLLAAAEVLGIAQAAFDSTRRHLADRHQFGQPLLAFQAIQHRLVNLYVSLRELAALLEVVQAAYDVDHPDIERLLWKLRAQASLTGRQVTQESIQLHGGMGMTAEMPAGDYYKRVMQIDSLYGSREWALDRLAETLVMQGRAAR
ncbi:MAG: acyl-CoA dehydrogenase [Gammaproteobacteria bacterium]